TTYGLFGPSHHRGSGPEVFVEGFGRAERLVFPTMHRLAGSTGTSCARFILGRAAQRRDHSCPAGPGSTATRPHARRRGSRRAPGGTMSRQAHDLPQAVTE